MTGGKSLPSGSDMPEADPNLGVVSSAANSHWDPLRQTVCYMLSPQSLELASICCLPLSPVPGVSLNPSPPQASGVTAPAAAPHISLMVVQTITNGLITTQNCALFFFKCSEKLTAPLRLQLRLHDFSNFAPASAVIFSVPKQRQRMDRFWEC